MHFYYTTLEDFFAGGVYGTCSRGFQPIVIPPVGEAVVLTIHSVAGALVAGSPTASTTRPDVVIPGTQQNPVSIVVRCTNIPLQTEIILDIKPANGPSVQAVGLNNTGTQASSTATFSVAMPRGAGTIQAKCISGIAGSPGLSSTSRGRSRSYAQTGLCADGEVFAKMEITATLGRAQEIAYVTESGRRFVHPRN